MWIKTLDNEIVNTDYIHMIYISQVNYEHKWHKWAVRAVVSDEIQHVTLYECENEQEAEYKLNLIMNRFNNNMNIN